MSERKFELMVVTPEKDFSGEILWVNRLFEEGMEMLHLRKPGQSSKELLRYLGGIEDQYHSRIMVHYQEEVRNEAGVKGIHYHFRGLPEVKPAWPVSCGLHSWDEYRIAEGRFDYAFISPFFNSISKTGYEGNPELQHIPTGVNRDKLVALGGIKPSNISRIKDINLKGAAVLGYIWNNTNPVAAYKKLKEKTDL